MIEGVTKRDKEKDEALIQMATNSQAEARNSTWVSLLTEAGAPRPSAACLVALAGNSIRSRAAGPVW